MEPNPKVKIISDSTCDLSQELTAKYDIDILPLHILLGENEFRDGKDITPERIFAWADANKATPKTSAPSLEDAKALLLEDDKEIKEMAKMEIEELEPKIEEYLEKLEGFIVRRTEYVKQTNQRSLLAVSYTHLTLPTT